MPRILTARDEARQVMLEKVNMIQAIRIEENLFSLPENASSGLVTCDEAT
jgi:hypothetical protein